MAKQLTLDEMLECLQARGHPAALSLQNTLEAIGSAMAQLIAADLHVETGPARFLGTATAGTCAPFTPMVQGQPCPEPLAQYDRSEWDEGMNKPASSAAL